MKELTISRFEPLDYACNEALNTLSTNLSFAGNSIKRILLTSCRAQEGKSFLSMNLLRTLSDIGKRVILVDADLRRSVLTSRYGIQTHEESMMGLSHYLAGMCSLEDAVYSTNIYDAYLMPSGYDVVNSLALLNTSRLAHMLEILPKTFDIVLIDAPPVGAIIDAAQIAKLCDGVVFVISDNTVTRHELAEATRQIRKTGCPILGAVLNKVAFDTQGSKKYYYKTYYTRYQSDTQPVKRQGTGRTNPRSKPRALDKNPGK